MSSGLSRRVATVVGMRVSAMLSPWGPLVWVVDSVRALCLIFGFFCVLSGVGLLSVWSCWCRCWWCSGSGDLDWSFFFFDSRLLSVLGGSWMLADVALGCGWSAVGGVGEGGGGGGGGGGDGGGVVLAGRVVAAVLGSYWFSSWKPTLRLSTLDPVQIQCVAPGSARAPPQDRCLRCRSFAHPTCLVLSIRACTARTPFAPRATRLSRPCG